MATGDRGAFRNNFYQMLLERLAPEAFPKSQMDRTTFRARSLSIYTNTAYDNISGKVHRRRSKKTLFEE